jgi:hypothetical protein
VATFPAVFACILISPLLLVGWTLSTDAACSTARWLRGWAIRRARKRLVYDGTVGALIRCYETDKTSPYRALRQSTARVYGDWCRTLDRAIGKRRVDRVTGQDIRDCFLRLMEPATPGGAPRVRLAKSCVREMLSILVRYGAELGLPGCLELHQVLGLMVLTVPEDIRRAWKAARPKKTGMRYEHAAAIVAEGLKRGTRRHRSVALGVGAQFELTMRQADLIGVWEKPGQGEVVEPSAIIRGRWIWRPGLRFEDFAAGQLDLETMKNAGRAVFDVTAYPLFQQALAAVPAMERYGPLVTDEGGTPVSRRYYWDLYRDVADAAGVPRNVWNMHARHGGASEAQQAGVALQDIAEHAQHADINTTRKHYIIPRRVAKQRVAHRQTKVDKR